MKLTMTTYEKDTQYCEIVLRDDEIKLRVSSDITSEETESLVKLAKIAYERRLSESLDSTLRIRFNLDDEDKIFKAYLKNSKKGAIAFYLYPEEI